MLRKAVMAALAVASISLIPATEASARGGFHGGGGGFHAGGMHRGFGGGGWRGAGYGGLGFGVGLGLAGAYGGYGYAPYYASYGAGGCYFVHRRVWSNYGWRVRPVRVCAY